MKTATEWLDIFDDNLEKMTVKKLIEQVQDDALDSASETVLAYKYQKGSMNYNLGFVAGQILNKKSTSVAAMPNASS